MSEEPSGPGVAGSICQCSMQNPEPPSLEPCRHNGLMVTRPDKVSIHVSDDTPQRTDLLQVVAGPDSGPATIECLTEIVEGPCQGTNSPIMPHKGRVFDLSSQIYDPSAVVKQTDTELAFKAHCVPFNFELDDVLDFIWPMYCDIRHYTVYVNTCRAEELTAKIAVYPDIHWDVKLAFGFREYSDQQAHATGGVADHGADRRAGTTASKTLTDNRFSGEFNVKVKYDGGKTFDAGAKFRRYTETCMRAVNASKELVDYLAPRMKKFGGAKVTVSYPKIALTGDWQWKAIAGSPLCGFRYKAAFGFQPLFGLTGEVDLLTALLNATGPAGATLNFIREWVRDNPDGTLDIYIKAALSGRINGTLNYEKKEDDASGTTSGEISTPISITVEGGGKLELKVLFIQAGAQAKLGAKAAVTPSLKGAIDEQGPYLHGKVHFNGVAIYGALLIGAQGTIEKKATATEETDVTEDAGTYSQKTSSGSKSSAAGGPGYEKEFEWIWIEPRDWLDKKYYIINNK